VDRPKLLEAVASSPGGRRLLGVFADLRAEKARGSRGRTWIDGAFGDAALLSGDALVDVVAGRTPPRWTLAAVDPIVVAGELRRRLRGTTSSRRVQGAVLLENEGGLSVRVVEAIDAPRHSPLGEPVVTMRALGLVLDGPHAGTLRAGHPDAVADLLDGRLRLTDDAALDGRPEAIVTLARLAARPGVTLDVATARLAATTLTSGAFARARLSRLRFPLDDLLQAPEAIDALELLQGFAPQVPLHESAEIDGDLLRRADALRPPGASPPLTLQLAIARSAYRHRIRSFVGGHTRFDGPEAAAVIAAAGPEDPPRWSQR
jgi:hypothetical protein